VKVDMHFEGGKELAAELAQLSEKANKRNTTEALTFGGEPIRATAARQAPRLSPKPDLADNIVISNQRLRGDETAAVAIGPAKGFAYGLPRELGTAFHGAQPFLRPAFDAKFGEALDRVRQEFWRLLAAAGIRKFTSSPSTPSSPGGGGLP
jgi:HK97 gp10 family phage protein